MLTDDIKSLLLMGWGAGGDPETALLVAKANRLKGKLIAIIKVIKRDWQIVKDAFSFIKSSANAELQNYSIDVLEYAIRCLLSNSALVIVVDGAFLQECARVAAIVKEKITNCLNILLLHIEYGYNKDHFLITPKIN
jgi:hypothetical protein